MGALVDNFYCWAIRRPILGWVVALLWMVLGKDA